MAFRAPQLPINSTAVVEFLRKGPCVCVCGCGCVCVCGGLKWRITTSYVVGARLFESAKTKGLETADHRANGRDRECPVGILVNPGVGFKNRFDILGKWRVNC